MMPAQLTLRRLLDSFFRHIAQITHPWNRVHCQSQRCC
jgi:hypothetical protein